jgi:hypothetical protein
MLCNPLAPGLSHAVPSFLPSKPLEINDWDKGTDGTRKTPHMRAGTQACGPYVVPVVPLSHCEPRQWLRRDAMGRGRRRRPIQGATPPLCRRRHGRDCRPPQRSPGCTPIISHSALPASIEAPPPRLPGLGANQKHAAEPSTPPQVWRFPPPRASSSASGGAGEEAPPALGGGSPAKSSVGIATARTLAPPIHIGSSGATAPPGCGDPLSNGRGTTGYPQRSARGADACL